MSALIDWEQLDMIADGFTPDFVEIYREFVSEMPALLSQLRDKVLAGDSVAAAKVAHQIKGSSANFGFVGVSRAAATLEQSAKAGSLADASALLGDATLSFEKAVAEVRALRSA